MPTPKPKKRSFKTSVLFGEYRWFVHLFFFHDNLFSHVRFIRKLLPRRRWAFYQLSRLRYRRSVFHNVYNDGLRDRSYNLSKIFFGQLDLEMNTSPPTALSSTFSTTKTLKFSSKYVVPMNVVNVDRRRVERVRCSNVSATSIGRALKTKTEKECESVVSATQSKRDADDLLPEKIRYEQNVKKMRRAVRRKRCVTLTVVILVLTILAVVFFLIFRPAEKTPDETTASTTLAFIMFLRKTSRHRRRGRVTTFMGNMK